MTKYEVLISDLKNKVIAYREEAKVGADSGKRGALRLVAKDLEELVKQHEH